MPNDRHATHSHGARSGAWDPDAPFDRRDRETALGLVIQTFVGAAHLAKESDRSLAELREMVTSPGGTTQAALEVLMAPDGLQPLLDRAIAAAARRSRDLA